MGAQADPFDRIPKVELHCHVEGTVRPQTVLELAAKAGRPLPAANPADLYAYDSLDSFLSIFWLVQETLISREDWSRVAYESLMDGTAHGLRYREMFFTPARHLAGGQDLGTIVSGLTEGIEAAEAEAPVRCFLIADIDRAFGPPAGLALVEGIADLRRAGEAVGCGPSNIEIALDVLGAERIDHGVALPEDPALLARVATEGIPLTVCPTSNVVIANRFRSLADHPLLDLYRAGVRVTINTDDPAMLQWDLGREYAAVGEAYGLDIAAMGEMTIDGIDSTWLDEPDRRSLRTEFRAALIG
ncbi:MAG: adenosine deaminase family protein [Actinomycetota bacterium]